MQTLSLLSCAVFAAGLASLDATRAAAPSAPDSLFTNAKGALTFVAPLEGTRALKDDDWDTFYASLVGDTPYDPENPPLGGEFHRWDGELASQHFGVQHQKSGSNKSAYYGCWGFPFSRWWHITEGDAKSWFERDPWW